MIGNGWGLQVKELEEKLLLALVPKDENDIRDAIVEVILCPGCILCFTLLG